jgi:hypothetical protein
LDSRNVLNDRVTAVLGFAELLLDGSYGNLSAVQKAAINNVVAAARDARDILRDCTLTPIED